MKKKNDKPKNKFQGFLTTILVIFASFGLVLAFNELVARKYMNKLVGEYLLDYLKSNMSDMDLKSVASNVASDNNSNQALVWFRGYTNGDYSIRSGSFSTKVTNNDGYQDFYYEKIKASGKTTPVNVSYTMVADNAKFKVDGSSRKTIVLSPSYNKGLDTSNDNYITLDTSKDSKYQVECYPYFDNEAACASSFSSTSLINAEQSYYQYAVNTYGQGTLSSYDKNSLSQFLTDNNLNPVNGDVESILAVKKFIIDNKEYEYDSTADSDYSSIRNCSYDFLTSIKKGSNKVISWALCELYRSRNIPARTVTGYLGFVSSESSEIQQYFTHVWTEVYIQGSGWIRADASLKKRFIDYSVLDEDTTKTSSSTNSNNTTLNTDKMIQQYLSSYFDTYLSQMLKQSGLLSDASIQSLMSNEELKITIKEKIINSIEEGKQPTIDDFQDLIQDYLLSQISDDYNLEDYYFPDLDKYNNCEYQSGVLVNKTTGAKITYGDLYTQEQFINLGGDVATYNEKKDEPVSDYRTEIEVTINDTAKLYDDGKPLSPDKNAFATIKSVTLHTKELPELFINYVNENYPGSEITSTSIKINELTKYLFGFTTNSLTWESLYYGFDLSDAFASYLEVDGEILSQHFKAIRNTDYKFELLFEKAARDQVGSKEEDTEYTSLARIGMVKVGDESTDNFKYNTGVVNSYFTITCTDGDLSHGNKNDNDYGQPYDYTELINYDETTKTRAHNPYFSIVNDRNKITDYSLTVGVDDLTTDSVTDANEYLNKVLNYSANDLIKDGSLISNDTLDANVVVYNKEDPNTTITSITAPGTYKVKFVSTVYGTTIDGVNIYNGLSINTKLNDYILTYKYGTITVNDTEVKEGA